ncbi:MAG: hypothetical protein HUU37_05165 [Bdellovibrionales bacterium]|nr:hypothetical protein [Bdellovibrionales bacterium]
MRPLRSLIAACLLLAAPPAPAETVDRCPGALDFDVQATLHPQGLTSLEKRGCRFRFAVVGGKGEKWQMDVCDPLVGVLRFDGIDDDKPKFIRAGSENCPAPLFGADVATSADSPERYAELHRKTMRSMQDIRLFHTPSRTDPMVKRAGALLEKMRCLERILERYLSECEAFDAPAKKPE